MTRRVAGGLGGLGLIGPLVRLVAGSHVSNPIGTGRLRAAAPSDPRELILAAFFAKVAGLQLKLPAVSALL